MNDKNKSWKTTASGIVTIVSGLLFLFCQFTGIDAPVVADAAGALAILSAGLTGLFAKDAAVTGLPK
jgi:hypothetical protein